MASTSTTFKVSDVTPTEFKPRNKTSDQKEAIQNMPQFRHNKCTEILQKSNFPQNCHISDNGFVRTVTNCYNNHHNLVVRPDDVWAAIMTQFSFYINKHAEEFRGQFVDFEGKKELSVSAVGSLRAAPYDLLVKLMSKKIDENLKDPEVKKWILPSFSTTTDNDLVTVGVVFMATMKKYFDYKFCLCCGIPSVTLEGTLEDWNDIRNRLGKLKEYKLEKWYDMLEPILTQFVNAKKGKADKDFWNRVCHYEGGGSGPTYLSGWITAFCVFDKEGNWQKSTTTTWYGHELEDDRKLWPRIDSEDVPTGIVEVDVTVDDNGTEHKAVMFAGHIGTEIKQDKCTLQPTLGWCMALKSPDTEANEPDPDADEMN